jgi:hypothetical protein
LKRKTKRRSRNRLDRDNLSPSLVSQGSRTSQEDHISRLSLEVEAARAQAPAKRKAAMPGLWSRRRAPRLILKRMTRKKAEKEKNIKEISHERSRRNS